MRAAPSACTSISGIRSASRHDLTTAALLRSQILGLPFVAFRDADGQAHVLAETCVHRGGSLSGGKLVNGRLACPYHGWQFDGSGRCQHIPSLGSDGNIPARAKVDSYPVIERYGIVFAFLGDLPEEERCSLFDIPEREQDGWRASGLVVIELGAYFERYGIVFAFLGDLPEAERCSLFEIPEWDQAGWRASGLVVIELGAYFERSIENGLDPVHNEFVHTLQGNIRFRPDRMRVTPGDWGTEVFVRMDPPKPGTTQLESPRNDADPEHFGARLCRYITRPALAEGRLSLTPQGRVCGQASTVDRLSVEPGAES